MKNPWLLIIALMLGMAAGTFSGNAKNSLDTLRIKALETSMNLCDTEVLRAQHELEEAREAFWRERK